MKLIITNIALIQYLKKKRNYKLANIINLVRRLTTNFKILKKDLLYNNENYLILLSFLLLEY